MTDLAYRQTTSPEPHRERRKRILRAHPEIVKLFGYDTRPVWRMALVPALQLAIAAAISALATSASAWFTALVLIAVVWTLGAMLNHYGVVVIHEASHNLCARTETQNRGIAIFANLPKVLPYAMTFRRHHLAHHRDMGVVGGDNDLPLALERRAVGNGPLRKLAWLFLFPLFGALCRGFLHRPDRWEVAQWATQLPLNALLVVFLLPPRPPRPMGPRLPRAQHLVQRRPPPHRRPLHPRALPLWDERQETYYCPLNALTENLGYHVEHHDFVAVPGTRLPEPNAIARDFYAPLVSHRSWTAILLCFVTDPRLSHFSRFVRPHRQGTHPHPSTCWVDPEDPRELTRLTQLG
ncbi:MAG: fatty acid desaturase [Sandaracinaceae bacterium]|nr:fatty acid desaturase [Sandaracinaceae bacterium]